jgi:hypothetical protein
MMMYKNFIQSTVFVILLGFFSPLVQAEESSGTDVMNSHGENMELEFQLYEPGEGRIIDYSKYGTFKNVGTDKYEYQMTNRKGLSAAVGEGIYPNNSVYKDPAYRLLMNKGKLNGSHWDYVNIENQQLAFYKWATTKETPAVQLFYTAKSLEKLGMTLHAINAYYALVVHYPRQIGWTIWHTPLYVSRVALDRIEYLTHAHPELGIKLVDAKIKIKNGYNADTQDDVFVVNPGKLIKVKPSELKAKTVDVSKMAIEKTVGTGSVKLVKFKNGHWQMQVNEKPFLVKGIAYSPTPVGSSPDEKYDLDSWQTSDLNQNGKIDGPFDAWVDKNKNLEQDPDEAAEGDFMLMKKMGVNTIRFYHHGKNNKELLRQLHKEYGIYIIMGDLLGMYAVGSGAEWFKGTDYKNAEQKEKMKESVRQMVNEYKEEPYVLMWMLGNESNYGEAGSVEKDKVGTGSQARTQPEAMYSFVNEVAGMIKQMDPSRPVGFSNGDVITIDVMSRFSDNIDIFGSNSYRGANGFGRSFWEDVKDHLDKPVLLTEYGCPAYFTGKNLNFGEQKQAEYHQGNWEDILANSAGSGFGNAIGGVIFEYVDEWWKAGPPPKFSSKVQETSAQFAADFPDGTMHEEWLGVTSQGDGSHSPYLRQTRKVYDYYKKVWNQK